MAEPAAGSPAPGGGLLEPGTLTDRLADLDEGWEIIEGRELRRSVRLPDFASALALAHQVGAIAEAQNHHPELTLTWGKLRIRIWSHDLGGLTERDLTFAAACDELQAIDGERTDA